MRVAIYARCSTGEQSPDMQLAELREFAERRGWEIYGQYVDVGQSGGSTSRPELNRLLMHAKRRFFDVVLVWRFDRFARSLQFLLESLEEFKSLNIDFVSLGENIDTSTPAGKLLFSIAGAFAQFERELIRERVRSGVQNHIRKNGSWGPERKFDWADAVKLRSQGLSIRKIAATLGVHRSSVQRALRGDK